jgi:hypothetical protein
VPYHFTIHYGGSVLKETQCLQEKLPITNLCRQQKFEENLPTFDH